MYSIREIPAYGRAGCVIRGLQFSRVTAGEVSRSTSLNGQN